MHSDISLEVIDQTQTVRQMSQNNNGSKQVLVVKELNSSLSAELDPQ